jgi:hypothetical protein
MREQPTASSINTRKGEVQTPVLSSDERRCCGRMPIDYTPGEYRRCLAPDSLRQDQMM